MTRTTARLTGLAGTLFAGTLLLAGCADDSSDTAHNGSMMGSSDTSGSASDSAQGTFNDADVAFASDMIPHHRQAIQMARLAGDQAEDPRVLDLAGRIEAAHSRRSRRCRVGSRSGTPIPVTWTTGWGAWTAAWAG